MFWIRADGAGKPQPLTHSKHESPWSVTADGKRLAFVELNPATGADLWTLPLESDGVGLRAGKPEVFLQTSFNERTPMFSPDGRWLAYLSDESGTLQLYVRAFPDRSAKIPLSVGGAQAPLWARNGRNLFFGSLDNKMMVAAYTVQGDSFVAEKPRVWSEKRLANFASTRSYDLAPDGKSMVALMPLEAPEEQKTQHHVIFFLNFFDELRRRTQGFPAQGK